MDRLLCSVFLSPAPSDFAWTSELIGRLAEEHGGIPFEPHLTLHSGIGSTAVIEEALAAEAAALPPMSLRPRRIGATGEFFRTLFIEFEPAPALLQLHAALLPLLERDREKPFLPHLSLLYSDMPLEEKRAAAARVPLPGHDLLFDRLKIVTLADPDRGWDDFPGWRTLLEIPFRQVARAAE